MASQPRGVVRVITPQPVLEGAGVRLRRSFPGRTMEDADPFLLFDDFSSAEPDDYRAGFPMHPHRGIETVTYILRGAVRHRDTLGSQGEIGAGDVQWMTAGRGILHEEMPQVRPEGVAGFQLWVNLPAKLKMSEPRYQDVPASRIPEVKTATGARIRVIAGTVARPAGPVHGPVTGIAVDPTYLDVTVPARSTFTHPIPREHTALLYLFEGEADVGGAGGGGEGGRSVLAPAMVVLGEGDGATITAGDRPARFLLASGRPLGEPVARHGPFVMNTEAEIRATLDQLRRGTFLTEPLGGGG